MVGCCECMGVVGYVLQYIVCLFGVIVVVIVGVQLVFDVFVCIEVGSVDVVDFEQVGECWDICQQLIVWFDEQGLGYFCFEQLVDQFSGGEFIQVVLVGVWFVEFDLLVLDEFINYFDCLYCYVLLQCLCMWLKGLLVISYDCELFMVMQCIVEFLFSGLCDYGGNYDFYESIWVQEQECVVQVLEYCKVEQCCGEVECWQILENFSCCQLCGVCVGCEVNQVLILFG